MFQRNDGNIEFKHENTDKVMAIPYDIPIVGYQNEVINTLRLWSAEPLVEMNKLMRRTHIITMILIISILLNKFQGFYILMIR